jgi:hypothetical protein
VLGAAALAIAALASTADTAHAVNHEPTSLCVSRFEWRHLRAAVAAPEPASLASVGRYLDGPGTLRGDQLHFAVCGEKWHAARVIVGVEGDHITSVFRIYFAPGFTA